MTASHSRPHARPRLRRWLIGIVIVLALLAAYAVALQKVSLQIGEGIEDSLRPAPALDEHTPRVN